MRTKRAPQQLRAERTRRHLLEAARRVFAERGYERATVDDVAEGADVSKGAFYFHFDTKEDVLLLLAEEWARARTSRLEDACRRATDLGEVAEALVSTGQEGRLFLEFAAQAERGAKLRPVLVRAHAGWKALLVRMVAETPLGEAAWQDDPGGAAEALLALCDGLTVLAAMRPAGHADVGARVRAALALLGGTPKLRVAS